MFYLKSEIANIHRIIDTPALLIDQKRLLKNIQGMQKLAQNDLVRLRPHIKTHKSIAIARKQIEYGAIGITVAKLSEAEIMVDAGINDIFIANQLTHPLKIARLLKLHNMSDIAIGIDHPAQVQILKKAFSSSKKPLQVLIEIDSGLHRCGIQVGEPLIRLAHAIQKCKGLGLKGIFTHAGQVYAATSQQEISRIGMLEGQIMQDAVNLLRKNMIEIDTVSVGSTPTVLYSAGNAVVTEIRPGNYVFYDNIQLTLGSCSQKQCALYVLATVISQPNPNQIVIDAGSKALNLDQGAHAMPLIKEYGKLQNIVGKIVRLSEEHGIIQLSLSQKIKIGAPVLILPNHACAVSNLYSEYHLIESVEKFTRIPVDARGRSQ